MSANLGISNYSPIKTRNNSLSELSVPNNFSVPLPVNTNYSTDAITVIQAASQPYLFSNNYWVLNYLYKNEGIVQTFVDLPVEDAFRGGFQIDTSDKEFNSKELKKVYDWIESSNVMEVFQNTKKWARLFGGGGMIISDGRSLSTEFKIENIKKGDKIQFIDANLWDLNETQPYAVWNGTTKITEFNEETKPINKFDRKTQCPYYWNGQKVHRSRVLRMEGKVAPTQLRRLLRGWGMSVVEKLIRPLANYYKLNDMTANYIDQAKIDIFKFAGLNEAFESEAGAAAVQTKATIAALMKGLNNGLALDSEDDYIQRQINFNGLPELKEQNRIELASALQFPVSKLFGTGSKGFSSGEDDLENYNSMIESTIRNGSTRSELKTIAEIGCMVCFGKLPEEVIRIIFNPLRVLTPLEDANLKNLQADLLIRFGDRQWLTPKQVMEQANILRLTPLEVDINEVPAETPPQPEPIHSKATDDAYGDDSKQRNKLFNNAKNIFRQ
jgi:phage-related protein (TIGR01555 family)